jgi:hypothetical protein
VDTGIEREKFEQAVGLFDACDSDGWLTFRACVDAIESARGVLTAGVLVTEDGADYLASVQRELIFVE